MKPIFNLTPEEQEIEDELERGDYVSIPATPEDKAEWAAIARNTVEKNKVITIRLSEKNLINVKAAAAREGLSYQTFITSLIHKNT
jgi:predicted DNA binding CopG/RHH family protein